MSVIRMADARRTETPGGVMTTLASATQGDAERSLWRVDVKPGGQGPLHDFDVEQVWTFIEGGATVHLGDDAVTVRQGDTVVMPPNTPRQVVADEESGYAAIVTASSTARATLPDGTDKGIPAWIA